MPWCPKCKYEFREGFTSCDSCGVPLVDELPSEISPSPGETFEEESFLINAATDPEADMIQSLLESNQIYSLRKHKGAGGYLNIYMGMSPTGVDIYVPPSQLQKAQELLNLPSNEPPAEISDSINVSPNKDEATSSIRSKLKVVLEIFLLVTLVPGLVIVTYNILQNLIESLK